MNRFYKNYFKLMDRKMWLMASLTVIFLQVAEKKRKCILFTSMAMLCSLSRPRMCRAPMERGRSCWKFEKHCQNIKCGPTFSGFGGET
jgi:hypothetical protein